MEKEGTNKAGTQHGQATAKQGGSLMDMCMSCCGKAGKPEEMMKMCGSMGDTDEMMKMCKEMGTSDEMMKMFEGMCKDRKNKPVSPESGKRH
jgi:hypothetical protein